MRPKLVCLTPVRNEAWCLDIFLKCTYLWADYIIIVDQNSKDGSREIARKYQKVILIENDSEVYDEEGRQKLLINESRKIPGDKILITLDADEVFTANFINTNDWVRILNSNPGEVFGIQWANICPDKKSYFPSTFYYPWVFHDDGITEHKKYSGWIHSMRIPFPTNADAGYYKVIDFKVFHFAWIDQKRVESKNRYYQCLVCLNNPNEHFISLFRSYNGRKRKIIPIPYKWLEYYKTNNIDLLESLVLMMPLYWYDFEVKDQFIKYGFTNFKYLDIWNKVWIDDMKYQLEISDPRNIIIKLFHIYLRKSQNFSNSLVIRLLDKAFKKIDTLLLLSNNRFTY